MNFSVRRAYRQIGTRLLDLVYPRVCPICSGHIDDNAGSIVCGECISTIEYIGEYYCQKCSQPIDDSFEISKGCPACSGLRLRFDKTVAVGRYYGGLKELILELKNGYAYIARFLGKLLADKLRRQNFINEVDLIVTVPIWRWSIFRKCNQARLLAAETANFLGISYSNQLVKIRHTPPQVSLDRDARLKNLEDAFVVKSAKNIKGKNVLVIDDVMTTGTTVSECAKALKEAGAKSVYAAVVARAIHQTELI